MYFDDLIEVYYKEHQEQEVFHDLMRFRVHEILLVASLYDSFVVKQDGALSEQVYGEFYSLNLSGIPRVTCAYTFESAKEMFSGSKFDMVILMAGLEYDEPLKLAEIMKKSQAAVPVFLLAMNNSSLARLDRDREECRKYIDRIFVWNGYSKLLVSMIKYTEDMRNAVVDTEIGLARVILLVEDSIRYYSRYLPILYSVVLNQIQSLVEEERSVEINKIRIIRWRPKILHAVNFEDALDLFNRYEPFLLTVISDIKYPLTRNGVEDPEAGFKFLEEIRSRRPGIPVFLQSTKAASQRKAFEMGAAFADKNSNTLGLELGSFFHTNLGYGPFVFRTPGGAELSRAASMDELEAQIRTIPDDCLNYHASRNDFSTWLMARGEMLIGRVLRDYSPEDFETPDLMRKYLLGSIFKIKKAKARGSLPMIDRHNFAINQNPELAGFPTHRLLKLGSGSVGGKGRGLMFIGSLIENLSSTDLNNKMEIQHPYTAFIGIDEFEKFLGNNKLRGFSWFDMSDNEIKEMFLSKSLSPVLIDRLRLFLQTTKKPLAVRSSGLFEDMLMVPFSGVYDTYIIPNDNADLETRLSELCGAVKLVYASLFSESARAYFDSAAYIIDEERMAIIIQEFAGSRHGRWYYPIISGTAQSYNYYPFSYLKPDDGLSTIAIGCGCHVVNGGVAFRFSPRYPKLDITISGSIAGSEIDSTQRTFYALDMENPNFNLLKGSDATLKCLEISEAENNPAFPMTVSTYSKQDDRLVPGTMSKGIRIVNFAPILRHDKFPFAEVLDAILDISAKSMGVPVEIEFAVDYCDDKPVLYLLQIKPLIQTMSKQETDLESVNAGECFVISCRSMGNGKDTSVTDIVWVDPEKFSPSNTLDIAQEIGELNTMLKAQNLRYVLIGPGRWGTKDFSIGIPVNFPQISFSRVIVEANLPNFIVESSQGSHFFHNVTSMNIGYLSVSPGRDKDLLDWEWLKSLPCEKSAKFCRWSKTKKPLNIIMDGRSGNTIIYK